MPVHVEYRYDPQADELVLHRDTVHIDFQDGSCVVRSREDQAEKLVKVDRPQDEVAIPAPVGIPDKPSKAKQKVVSPKDPLDTKKAKTSTNVGRKPTLSGKSPPDDLFGSTGSYSKNSQIAPQPQVKSPTKTADDTQAQTSLPQQAPNQAPRDEGSMSQQAPNQAEGQAPMQRQKK